MEHTSQPEPAADLIYLGLIRGICILFSLSFPNINLLFKKFSCCDVAVWAFSFEIGLQCVH